MARVIAITNNKGGCGKTTTGRSIIKLYNITSGNVYFKGQRIGAGTRSYKDAISKARAEADTKIKALKAEADADAIIINTCGFIGDAKKESIDTILSAVQAKEEGLIEQLFVIGCLSERYADELREEIPEVDEYFGVNEDILQNKFDSDVWAAFYEGAIEPFAIQFSEATTKALFSERERAQGSQLMLTANRLQYMSNNDKLNVSSQLLDRGIFSINDVREIWNLPPVENGDQRVIRGEYYSADDKLTPTEDINDGSQE